MENAAQSFFRGQETVFGQKTETKTAGKTTAEKAAGCWRACFFVSFFALSDYRQTDNAKNETAGADSVGCQKQIFLIEGGSWNMDEEKKDLSLTEDQAQQLPE